VGNPEPAGVPLLGGRRVAKGVLSFLGLFPFALSALTGEDPVGGGDPLLRVLEPLFD
jgi:hypothetical protein